MTDHNALGYVAKNNVYLDDPQLESANGFPYTLILQGIAQHESAVVPAGTTGVTVSVKKALASTTALKLPAGWTVVKVDIECIEAPESTGTDPSTAFGTSATGKQAVFLPNTLKGGFGVVSPMIATALAVTTHTVGSTDETATVRFIEVGGSTMNAGKWRLTYYLQK
jgi:hypothetical protein